MTDFTLEEYQAELEHLDFLDSMQKLIEEIAWSLANTKVHPAKIIWDDIRVFGNEPVFTSIIFDKLEKELS